LFGVVFVPEEEAGAVSSVSLPSKGIEAAIVLVGDFFVLLLLLL
jgi:hypothetical protein